MTDGMTRNTAGALEYLTADGMVAAGGVSHGFTTRSGGVSRGIYQSLNLGIHRGDSPDAVGRNFELICSVLGMDPRRLVFSKQVHEDTVRLVTEEDAGKGLSRPTDYTADALITRERNLPLVIFSADCVPILLYDPVSRSIGAVHSGWRGTALGIVSRAIKAMGSEFGARPEDILAAVGPAICGDCYETDGDVPEALRASLGGTIEPFLRPAGDKWHVDLKGINAHLMRLAGITPEHITLSEECTACSPQRYWSHRVTRGQRGSQAAFIQLL
ncbi:peptidoglycan editing factor PgeF [Papillibacter cinnamivorans]|uniref:Purine nucleoside phosphorylase n=1 Tax=Papillibacter cinnamivorans DSM 12816 TaxID=1122930 RepID=A0A1W2CSL1_9FIRM|nr:peptidoglycan editing factor PgeF [Papillibacter cinnamivorans]SMC87658.1 conserved hypothetical protein [Papillibacter cinnamivorans DSM 12816]